MPLPNNSHVTSLYQFVHIKYLLILIKRQTRRNKGITIWDVGKSAYGECGSNETVKC